MSTMGRSEIQSINKRRYLYAACPLGDGQVRLQSMTSGEMRRFKASMTDASGEIIAMRGDHLSELLLAHTLVDEDGTRLYQEEDVERGALDEVDGLVISYWASIAKKHTGFAIDVDYKAIEAAAKNSENGQTSASHAS